MCFAAHTIKLHSKCASAWHSHQRNAAALQQELHALDDIYECLVVNTCNRVEVYGLASAPTVEATVRDYLCARNGVSRELLDAHSSWHTNLDVLQHAFEVSSGLDSQIVGETDILGQMKSAYADARAAKCTGIVLNRLFEKSFQAAKSARTLTGITRGQVSIGSVAVDLAQTVIFWATCATAACCCSAVGGPSRKKDRAITQKPWRKPTITVAQPHL